MRGPRPPLDEHVRFGESAQDLSTLPHVRPREQGVPVVPWFAATWQDVEHAVKTATLQTGTTEASAALIARGPPKASLMRSGWRTAHEVEDIRADARRV